MERKMDQGQKREMEDQQDWGPISLRELLSLPLPACGRAASGQRVSAQQAPDAGEQSGAGRTSGGSCEGRSR